MKIFSKVLTVIALISAIPMSAQIQYEGEPHQWNKKDKTEGVNEVSFGALDMIAIEAEDEVVDQYKETPYRFGFENEVDINFLEEATLVELQNGDQLFQLNIYAENAKSISMNFNAFVLPKGCQLFVINESRTDYLGAFDHRSGLKKQALAIGLLHDDFVTVELYVPSEINLSDVVLNINQITQGYRSIINKFEDPDRGPFGTSGPCNINVNCPEGDDWQVEKKSVALIVSGGFAVCTGALVNNTNNDGTPYFLTANHCLGGSVGSWVFYFNHETAGCTGSTGPTDESVSGSVLVASNGGSDFGLLLLDETPPSDYEVEYAGWDASDDETVLSATGLHHPSGDLKKICHEEDAPYHANSGGAAVWYIDQWEEGVTESGSSGSPLFDNNHRIIGQLYGGFAACSGDVNNGEADWYGRFGVSWDGSSSTTRLKDWLDPDDTGTLILDGFPTGFVAAMYDATGSGVLGIEESVCGETIWPTYILRNNGSETLTSCSISFYINGGEAFVIPWSGSLNQYETEEVVLFGMTLQEGENEFVVNVSNPNGELDENEGNDTTTVIFHGFTGETHIFTINIILDEYGAETTWALRNESTVFYSRGPFLDDTAELETEEVVCVGTGCYDFVIYDSYGDGICCEFGEGSYTVYNEFNNVAATGGEFGYSESTEVCTAPIKVEEYGLENSISIYPNPAEDNFAIRADQSVDLYNYTITAITGEIVESKMDQKGTSFIDSSKYASGMYLIEFRTDTQKVTKKLIIK